MKITEDNVVQGIKNRNAAALEYVMDTYSPSIYQLVYRVLGGVGKREDIEECISDVFVDIWESITKYDPGKGSFKTWAYIVAKYKALDYRRNLKRKALEETIENHDIESDDSIEKNLLSKEGIHEVIGTVNTLGAMDKDIFYKRYFFYQSIESIAREFGLTKEAVYKRLWRSRNKLKESLEL